MTKFSRNLNSKRSKSKVIGFFTDHSGRRRPITMGGNSRVIRTNKVAEMDIPDDRTFPGTYVDELNGRLIWDPRYIDRNILDVLSWYQRHKQVIFNSEPYRLAGSGPSWAINYNYNENVERVVCPGCLGSRGYVNCPFCHGTRYLPQPQADHVKSEMEKMS